MRGRQASHLATLETTSSQVQGTAGEKKRKKKKKKKKKEKSSWGGEKASPKVGTVRGVEGKPEVGSSNKKFLAPAAASAGEFAGNVYRLTEEFRQGKGGGKGHQPHARTLLQARGFKVQDEKKKKKRCFQIVALPHPFSRKKKKSGGKSAWSSQFQPAKVSRLIAILGLRKLLKRALIASNVQQKWGVRVSVSLRAWLALARARSLSPAPSLCLPAAAGSCRPIRLPFSPSLAFIAFFLSFPTWRGPGCGARVGRTPGSAPPYSFAPGAAAARN